MMILQGLVSRRGLIGRRGGVVGGLVVGAFVPVAVAGPSPTSSYSVGLGGATVFGYQGDAFNTTYDDVQATNLLYSEIYAYSFDVTIETSNFALFSDIVIGFSSDGTGWSDSITLAPGVDSAGTMRFVSGPIAWTGVETDFSGALNMEVFSVFDQAGEEARLLDGSVFTFHTQIPTPGTVGVVAMGGVFGVRRRRR